jgi:hypothetical protein
MVRRPMRRGDMNGTLVVAGLLAIGVGLTHSILGEAKLIGPLLRSRGGPAFLAVPFARRTLRFAWHLTSVAWWGFAALFLALAAAPPDRTGRLVLHLSAGMFLVTGATTGLATGGRHLAWPLFLAIAGLAWFGIA